MKKVLSILLAMLMLTSLGISGYADDDLTTQLVLDRLTEGDEAAQTPSDQAANGALRLAEMVVALLRTSAGLQKLPRRTGCACSSPERAYVLHTPVCFAI